ncbi:MAG: tRNA (N(6)-L-threonylcarbamoyladenosine(37)-C(2))-methylthiotransferase MtaB [Syntrophobacterales bacterium]|nr:tRNA (N(6)-L-threonylcarbamoyladenosine(37)-C(2))-methylthiotransferase MtaB [Syntrophobacterales bacterium]
MRSSRYRIVTFGCKVNQYDSAALAAVLEAAGWRSVLPGEAAGLILVNTCTVTARADQEARQVIRRLAREHPGAALWVTGCYAHRAPADVAALPGVTGVFGNPEKRRLGEFLGALENGRPVMEAGSVPPPLPREGLVPRRFPGHTRAFLMIQEGCNHGCAYCIVPAVRGASRSLPAAAVMAALAELAGAGFEEVVLTGIDLGQYGRDLTPPDSLAGLLRRLAAGPRPGRLRLSSVEPQEVTPELLSALTAVPGLCPHFHLPLQSGSARVLAAMGRPYRPEQFRELAAELLARFPEAALGLDVLVGFPEEGPEDLAATYELIESLPVAYLHVFPFSPRPGTPAAALRPLPAREVRRRAAWLRELGRRKKAAFYQAQVGKAGEVLVERPARPGWLVGVSGNYLRVLLPGPPAWINRRLWVRFLRVQGELLEGEVLET